MERERAQTVLRVVFETFQGVTTSTILHSYCHVTGQNSIECQDVVQNESILSVLTTHRSRYACGNHGGQVHTHLTITLTLTHPKHSLTHENRYAQCNDSNSDASVGPPTPRSTPSKKRYRQSPSSSSTPHSSPSRRRKRQLFSTESSPSSRQSLQSTKFYQGYGPSIAARKLALAASKMSGRDDPSKMELPRILELRNHQRTVQRIETISCLRIFLQRY